jgi:hypothetical protein
MKKARDFKEMVKNEEIALRNQSKDYNILRTKRK